jgi:hypothetical protein
MGMDRDQTWFHHDEPGFAKWSREHPEGYVLSPATGVLHWKIDDCRHFKDFHPPRPWTNKPKKCFATRHELQRWAKTHGRSYRRCKSCNPEV